MHPILCRTLGDAESVGDQQRVVVEPDFQKFQEALFEKLFGGLFPVPARNMRCGVGERRVPTRNR